MPKYKYQILTNDGILGGAKAKTPRKAAKKLLHDYLEETKMEHIGSTLTIMVTDKQNITYSFTAKIQYHLAFKLKGDI
jgi:hypothetical protein